MPSKLTFLTLWSRKTNPRNKNIESEWTKTPITLRVLQMEPNGPVRVHSVHSLRCRAVYREPAAITAFSYISTVPIVTFYEEFSLSGIVLQVRSGELRPSVCLQKKTQANTTSRQRKYQFTTSLKKVGCDFIWLKQLKKLTLYMLLIIAICLLNSRGIPVTNYL